MAARPSRRRTATLALTLLGCLALPHVPVLLTSRTAPAVIYHNGVVLTMDQTRPHAQAIATSRDRITAVGDDEEVLPLADRVTRLVDLGGRTVLPGFIDSHAHWIGDGQLVGLSPEQAVEAALRRGWTSINEQFVDMPRLNRLRELDASGALRVRVNAYLPLNFTDDKFTWFLDHEPRYTYSSHLRVAGVKLFLDHDWGTDFHWDQVELDTFVLAAHRNGWQVSAHAVSARAHDQYLTSIARALAAHPDPDARHRVEHVVQLRDDQLARMRELGMIASIQPGLVGASVTEQGFSELVARGDPKWIARWRDLVDSGVRAIGSSDMPWLVLGLGSHATDLPHGSPLEAVHQAVTQRLTVDQALRMFTVDAAYGTFEEDVKGSLVPGKYADLVVLAENPTTAVSLPDVGVLATIVGGKVEHCADPVLCR
ncbi:amidohydrolase [Lentzea aerocolonigenes]|uniref:amidohydrolase n=1 Tax=Lentzea aerocolonigenes TaxID=68170 RepID=UPI0004C2B432|nr:amidohydrolase family protein [Lentzea aerocolonigenes]MCP2249670.1 hypothetical protein [Lentzea aerocolonigenes]